MTLSENSSELVLGHFYGLAASNLTKVTELWSANLYPSYKQDCQDPGNRVDFFTVFGVLFSGVTGIMAGANLSGDLKSPAKNIPRGTLSACLTTFLTFLVVVVLTSLTCDPALLQHDCMYMVQVSCSLYTGPASSLPCRSSPSSSRWCWWAWCWPPGPPASPT